MTAPLLERDAELRGLQATLRRAGRGHGSVVLVSGEAGIGKTSLVRAFAEQARTPARCRTPPAATPSSSPRCSPARRRRCPRPSATRCWRASGSSATAPNGRWSCCPPFPAGSSARWSSGCRATTPDEAERRGVLEADLTHVWFRHELARRAILQRLSASARVAANRQVLAALAKLPRVELSRLAHHAHEAGEPELVVEHGLAAAREAVAAGAFHEALAHYELVLRWADLLADEQRAAVMEDSVWVLYNLSRFEAAAARAREVVRLRERLGDPAALGRALTTLSRIRYMVNDPAGSERAVTRAVALLEPLGDRRRLARAYTYLAAILKLTDRLDEAIDRARQALELGERTGQEDVVAHSLNYLGYALLDRGDPGGAEHLQRSAAIARAAHHYEYAQRLHQPGRGPVPPGTLLGAGRADRAGAGICPRVRLRLPRVQPGGAPLHAAHPAGTVGGGGGRAAVPAGR